MAPRSMGCAAALALALSACGAAGAADPSTTNAQSTATSTEVPATGSPSAEQLFPEILAVELRPTGEDTFDVLVTVSSPYDSAERYADGWRVLTADGTILGEHQLAHDHADEQPFTRTMAGVTLPTGVDRVTVEGRDRVNGYGGSTITVTVPRG